MIRPILLTAMGIALTASSPPPRPAGPLSLSGVRVGQTVSLAGRKVTVLKVLEDSRCPVEVDCVWSGQVTLHLRVERAGKTSLGSLGTYKPLPVAGGELELVDTLPERSEARALSPADYRFTLKFRVRR